MSDDLISRKELRKAFKKSQFFTEVNLYYARQLIDNAPTVCNDNYAMGYQDGVKKVLSERPQGERAERALAIIDRLRTDGYINNKEQGTLRRAILLPERSQGVWIKHIRSIECSVCKNKFFADDEDENCQDYEPCTDLRFNFCPNCGADMRGGRE